jgi:predicted MPP superfamily phosphohydrolase
MTRRGFLKWLSGLALSGAALTGYAFAIEPGFRLRIQRYAFTPPNWTPGLKLRVACLADPHLGEPHMPLSRWRKIVDTANRLEPDLTVLLGDYAAGHRFVTRQVEVADTARVCAGLTAPLGRYAIMGNHDWWDDLKPSANARAPSLVNGRFYRCRHSRAGERSCQAGEERQAVLDIRHILHRCVEDRQARRL